MDYSCRADAYSLLGFVFRKKPSSDATRSEKYYNEALEIHPGHCEAWSYKGELYLDQGSLEDASAAYTSLSNLAASTAASGAGQPRGCVCCLFVALEPRRLNRGLRRCLEDASAAYTSLSNLAVSTAASGA
ncbi:hypothetical protein T484DRAFT_1788251, partial [Baffinella frigidus]